MVTNGHVPAGTVIRSWNSRGASDALTTDATSRACNIAYASYESSIHQL